MPKPSARLRSLIALGQGHITSHLVCLSIVRGAFIGLGDVQLAQGDVAAALESYQQALTGGTPGDTITQRAQAKINALGKADAPSSAAPPKQE